MPGTSIFWQVSDGSRRPLSTGATPRPLLKTWFNESQARISPDGRWLAYVWDESGHDEVGRS